MDLDCSVQYIESAHNPIPTKSPNTWSKVTLQIMLICYQVMLGFHESTVRKVTEFPNWKRTRSQLECGNHRTRLRNRVFNLETQLIVIVWSPLLYSLSFLIVHVLFVSNSWQHQSGVSQPAEGKQFTRTCILLNVLNNFCSWHSNRTSESSRKTKQSISHIFRVLPGGYILVFEQS